MIDFFKKRKIVIIIGILVMILIGWKIYDSSNFYNVESEGLLTSEKENETNSENDEKEMIIVHITGEVNKPGIVKTEEGSRVADIIESAGGLTENADISNVNLAYIVEDGVKIKIPSNSEQDVSASYIIEGSGENIVIKEKNSDSKDKLNINTATENEFEELPGIGPAIANKIVEFRNQNGKFKEIEDIKNVTGIGNSKFEKIKDLIKIK